MLVQTESDKGNAAGPLPFTEMRRVISGHMPALDGIRGASMVVVLIVHFAWIPGGLPGKLFRTMVDAGWISMASFFVLSGFLITGILLDSKGAENHFSSFYLRRALRILPLYYSTLFVAFILCPLLGKLGLPFFPKKFLIAQIWYWCFVGNLAWLRGQTVGYFEHFWSLAVEEQFYLVWPLVVFLTSRRTLAKICIVLALITPILRIVFYMKGLDGDAIYTLTTSHLDAICLGALAAMIVRDENWFRRLIPRLNYFMYPSLAIFCLMGVAMGSFTFEGLVFSLGATPVAVFFTALLLRAVATTGSRSPLQRLLQARWLRSCGKYSYAMYVLHVPMMLLYRRIVMHYLRRETLGAPLRDWLHHPSMPGSAIVVTLCIIHTLALCLFFFGVGKFSWWAFEGPINNLKKHFQPHWRSGPPKPAEA